jgi:predicted Rossmann fold nucleotide-binding protein DprA/Smf involved in DNA uptake
MLFPADGPVALDHDERAIVECLTAEELHVEQILVRTSLSAARVAAQLTSLQLKGLVVALPGNRYTRRTRSAVPR